jgi:anti-anti-sigma factor
MHTAADIFEVDREGDTVVLTPQADLREMAWREIEHAGEEVLRLLDDRGVRNVVIDLCRTTYYGSTALGVFARLWHKARERSGRLAFCNVSEREQEILATAGLVGLWPVYPSREAAVDAVAER